MFLIITSLTVLDGAGTVIVLCCAVLVGAKTWEFLGCYTSAVEVFIPMGCGTTSWDFNF